LAFAPAFAGTNWADVNRRIIHVVQIIRQFADRLVEAVELGPIDRALSA
jgi:hypothetical protein